jgi:hypothetical protein
MATRTHPSGSVRSGPCAATQLGDEQRTKLESSDPPHRPLSARRTSTRLLPRDRAPKDTALTTTARVCPDAGTGPCSCARAAGLADAFTGTHAAAGYLDWNEGIPGQRWTATGDGVFRYLVEYIPDADCSVLLLLGANAQQLACSPSIKLIRQAAEVHAATQGPSGWTAPTRDV